jgi:hypothetical protein
VLVENVKFSVVSLTFGSEAGISAIRCLGSGFSDLQFWFLFWSALQFIEILYKLTWKSFFLFSFFFFELAVMMSDYWNPANQVRDPLNRRPSPYA